ncbi:MAG: tRNA (adenosine(37)-N6)-dimethylallyltransferase MiaA [Clostridia bacterium]|nr:tRNA (adenosine(37)-N6)-dimethylallyltransferase MiaA [Clostridia bacterium]
MKKILIITGPTASGKTDFSIICAKKFNGEIISADSMAIYKDLNIGTAKPTAQEQTQVKHHMIDIVEAKSEFSVQQFATLANKKIDEILKKGKLPILVGGTGLYIKSIIYPYSFCSTPKDEKIREYYNNILKEKGKEFLFNLLLEKDASLANKLHINDTKRVIRALEIREVNGENNENLNFCESEEKPSFDYTLVSLDFPREKLYERINFRVEKMFDKGLLDEVLSLIKEGKIERNCQSMQAIGYKELFKYFDKELSLNEAKELIKKNTRNYAKRQLTFIRGFKDVFWFDPQNEIDKALNYIQEKRWQ